MFQQLSSKGINVPDGFVTSAETYWKFIRENEIKDKLKETLSSAKADDSVELETAGKKCRKLVMEASIPKDIEKAILSRKPGSKKKMMVYEKGKKSDETIKNKRTPVKKRKKYVLNDEELVQLGK